MDGKHDENGNWRPYNLTLDLVDVPPAGTVQTIVRTMADDKKDVNRAALALHMGQAEFCRMVLIGVARKILSEVATNSKATFQDGEGQPVGTATG